MLCALGGCDQAARVVAQAAGQTSSPNGVSFQARVVGITDGDTLTALDSQNRQHKIRLAEIDAPERGQPWGDPSREALSALVFSKTVSVQQTDTDRYGRIVARVFVGGLDVNRAMVAEGQAWAYRRYLTDQTLIATEARARRERAGLWSLGDAQTVAPWEWRDGVRAGTGSVEPARAMGPRTLFKASPNPQPSDGRFRCSTKRYCREMNSCAEAHYYLRQCGVSSLDGNGDGEPCEALCGTMSR
jgi:endonuclease YncB( thermonuclease family)